MKRPLLGAAVAGPLIGLATGSLPVGIVATAALVAASLAFGAQQRSAGLGRWVWALAAAAALALAVIQLVPYGRDHGNPAATMEPEWNSSETRALAVTACFDCHSNATKWPWYTDVAPVSWWVTNHVVEGRQKLNFSTWDRPQHEVNEIAETIREGSMPPFSYVILHPDARLDAAEKKALIEGFDATLRASPPIRGGGD